MRHLLACKSDNSRLEGIHVTFIRNKDCKSSARGEESSGGLYLAAAIASAGRLKASENEGWTERFCFFLVSLLKKKRFVRFLLLTDCWPIHQRLMNSAPASCQPRERGTELV